MDVGAQQLRHRLIHQLVSLQARAAGEAVRDHGYGEVPAGTRAGVTFVLRTVVTDLQRQRREARGQRLADPCDAFGGAHVVASRGRCRASQVSCRAANTTVAAVRPNSLKFTQARSLALKATSR